MDPYERNKIPKEVSKIKNIDIFRPIKEITWKFLVTNFGPSCGAGEELFLWCLIWGLMIPAVIALISGIGWSVIFSLCVMNAGANTFFHGALFSIVFYFLIFLVRKWFIVSAHFDLPENKEWWERWFLS